jgi:fructosamine-3-kinase
MPHPPLGFEALVPRSSTGVHSSGVTDLFEKNYDDGVSARAEAAGLRWLAQAEDRGGAHVAKVISVENNRLQIDRIREAPATPEAARVFGAALAKTHAAGADNFGSPPPDYPGSQCVGRAKIELPSQPPSNSQTDSWGRFYAKYQVMPHALAADRLGNIPGRGLLAIAELADRLAAGDFDYPQPDGIPRVARIHGDLWAGNVLWQQRRDGVNWTGAALIDPLAHGGHAETDLAMLQLFNTAYLAEILDGYQSVSPLAAGWRNRVALHQLYPLLLHAELFGGGYGRRAVEVAKRYL